MPKARISPLRVSTTVNYTHAHILVAPFWVTLYMWGHIQTKQFF